MSHFHVIKIYSFQGAILWCAFDEMTMICLWWDDYEVHTMKLQWWDYFKPIRLWICFYLKYEIYISCDYINTTDRALSCTLTWE